MEGRHCASCTVVVPSICCMAGSSTWMQPAFTFHFLSSMPASSCGITKSATPWPLGEMFWTMAVAAFSAGAASLLLSKRGISWDNLGSTKGVAAASISKVLTAVAFLSAASLPEAAKASSISLKVASSTLASTLGAALVSSFFLPFSAAFLSVALPFSAALSASFWAWASAALTSSLAFRYFSSFWSFFNAFSKSFFFFLLGSLATSCSMSSTLTSWVLMNFFSSSMLGILTKHFVNLNE
mmetsp:Transcript_46614/g.110835  ORF Transcript_46614/g.110835 Transcript_46614/m.110835 type:complete len:240 (+) Transcript_46614:3591-4310(+)